jgi:hypothetical protein
MLTQEWLIAEERRLFLSIIIIIIIITDKITSFMAGSLNWPSDSR